ncbi:lipopolysaccharide assembly protein LapA domain-containing protein [Nocardioides sp. cx-169]|uniref:lipopolysaccharide assembly protein LapA domain-containing protein n=1 Tax=Nocardioides sp. cx-169 TaxID=2899080 RepID=UPI001E5B3B6D|nr:lipopolysaccharide assembly protein LapA domain-containing protein [Nocardioides sp. cx-169]MCD4534857.1 lipopolysaccharide assembly protein LapA domain-containing protein [Nocardioides sp. cx-169]
MTQTPDEARDPLLGQPEEPPRAVPPPEQPARAEPPRRDVDDPLRGSRTSGFWVAVVGLGLVLLLLIIFIAQNTRSTTVSFLAWDGQVPVAVAILIAAVAGLFLAGLAGTMRILQLRRRVRRTRG